MKKLKTKTFFTIFTILSFSVFSFILIFNIQYYLEQKKSVQNSLELASNSEKKEIPREDNKNPIPPNENIKFVDSTIYTVLLDEENSIKDVINHSSDELSNEEIKTIANKILKQDPVTEYIGNLYWTSYSYHYHEGESLVIIKNNETQNNLLNLLKVSLVIEMILEIIIFLISKIITNWIVKPVQDSFERQKQFIADASHELKTPLAVIMASSEELEQNPSERKWIQNIEYESNRMNSLITDLLELASSEEKKKVFEIGDLSKIVELSVLAFEGIAYEKNLKLTYEIEDSIKMKMDENSMKQLVEILLDNALKHAKSSVIVKLKQTNELELMVQNDGLPIPKGQEQKIFERFYRVDESRSRKENRYGLGLAIAKNIVENHQGKIEAYSNNEITIFKVILKNKNDKIK